MRVGDAVHAGPNALRRSDPALLSTACGALPQTQPTRGYVACDVEWLGMIEQFGGLLRQGLNFLSKPRRFALRSSDPHFMKLVEARAYDGPESVFVGVSDCF